MIVDNSQDVGLRFRMKYKIYVSENDEEGIEVSALDLYKFLRGKKAVKQEGQRAKHWCHMRGKLMTVSLEEKQGKRLISRA